MKMKNSIWNLVWVCLLCSCNSWLDIKLINQSEESELFSTERGFSEALAGVYSCPSCRRAHKAGWPGCIMICRRRDYMVRPFHSACWM